MLAHGGPLDEQPHVPNLILGQQCPDLVVLTLTRLRQVMRGCLPGIQGLYFWAIFCLWDSSADCVQIFFMDLFLSVHISQIGLYLQPILLQPTGQGEVIDFNSLIREAPAPWLAT